MAIIKRNHTVKKTNVLNDMLAKDMTLQELRFFSIYLSKINSNDLTTRIVKFPISDFQNIMDLSRIKIDYMKQVTNKLLGKVVNIPTECGGYTAFQLFKECVVNSDATGEWYVEIDAHDKALPLMFDYKEKYFSYQLWNILCLKSPNQLRMYEFLKQYENIGERVTSVEGLKQHLGVERDEYERFGNFKNRVLDACQKALEENTDITFTYEPWGKRGKGGKIQFLKFIIRKNPANVGKLTLEEFIAAKEQPLPKLAKKEKPAPPQPVELGFITETLSQKELSAIWQAANGNVALIQNRYHIAKQQREIKNLVGFMIWAVQKPDEEFRNTTSKGKNAFRNYEERIIDCDALQRKENKYNFEMLEQLKQAQAEQQKASEAGV